MAALTVRKLLEILNESITENPADIDCIVVLPMKTDIPNMFSFEEACPGVSEIIEVGPAPDWINDGRGENKHEPMRVFLIAPHSFHGDNEKIESEHKMN